MKNAWENWVKIVKIVVNIQVSVLLFVLYYVIIVPMSLVVKIISRHAFLGHSYNLKEKSLWSTRTQAKHSLIWARAQ